MARDFFLFAKRTERTIGMLLDGTWNTQFHTERRFVVANCCSYLFVHDLLKQTEIIYRTPSRKQTCNTKRAFVLLLQHPQRT